MKNIIDNFAVLKPRGSQPERNAILKKLLRLSPANIRKYLSPWLSKMYAVCDLSLNVSR